MNTQSTLARFDAATKSLQRVEPPTLGELIDAAVLASHRFRTCHCRDDCSHDAAALEAEQAVRNYMRNNLGLTHDQADALGGIL